MELEVGMYVRYKTLSNRIKIAKIIEIDKKVLDLDNKDCTTEKYIIGEPSHNIIDLIEVGDYIRIVTSAYFEPVYYSYGKLVIRDDIDISKYTNKFVAEVITHEQMGSMSYKLGGK